MKTKSNKCSNRNVSNLKGVAIGSMLSLLASTGMAGEALVSDGYSPGDSKSKWVVGGAIGAIENPFIGEDSIDAFIVPNVEYRGERLYFKAGELGVNLFRSQGFGAGFIVTGNESFLSDEDFYDDNKQLEGIKERDGTLDAGFYLVHNSELGQLRMRFLEEVTGEHDGRSVDANYTFDLAYEDIRINPVVGVAWTSADMVDHFFGVSESEANEYRAEYKGENATSFYTGVRGRYEFTEHWEVDMGAYYVKLGSGISDSTLLEEDDLIVTSVGVNYNF
ncbi:MAG: MipA/OmpV family protein [Pseudomonadales bacterium]|nr:MipA/OmpV family protein [Pseudomonadales bacterium]